MPLAPGSTIKVIGIAGETGSMAVEACEIEARFGKAPGSLTALSGVQRLRCFPEGDDLLKASVRACHRACKSAGVTTADLHGVFASVNPTSDYLIPSFAPLAAEALGLSDIRAATIGLGCAGGVQALEAAVNQLLVDELQGKETTYVVLTGDQTSRMLDRSVWATSIFFSEGVSAVVVTNRKIADPIFIVEQVATCILGGEDTRAIQLENPYARAATEQRPHLTIQGKGVFKFGTTVLPKLMELVSLGSLDKVYLIPHQANLRMLNVMQESAGLSSSQFYTDGITKIGNISGAACYLGLEDAVQRRLYPDDWRVLLGAFGAELQLGAALLRPGNLGKLR